MEQTSTISGLRLKDMLAAAVSWLEKSAEDINALNVFPVPDGDTGTNMLLTMRSGVEETNNLEDNANASAVAQAMSKGSLMGARGNSGVILSQIWNGFAQAVTGKEEINGVELAQALLEASDKAYKGLSNPVEGTILTVIKDSSQSAQKQAATENNSVVSVIEAAVESASESVANTPNLLSVLRDAGVVDAGGQGIFTILEGMMFFLKDETELMQFRKSRVITSTITGTPVQQVTLSAEDEEIFGYCTEFLIKGSDMDPEKIRGRLKSKGESLIVVGDSNTVRVHIHTTDPGNVLHYIASFGTMHGISIRNMDEQHSDFMERKKELAPTLDIAVVSITAGEGLSEVMTSLGAAAVVSGGQTMNPSTKDIFQATERIRSDKIIILPNNKNIITTAEQVHQLTDKKVAVIPSKFIPQGISALLAFDYEADFDTNVKLMNEAISHVTTIEITKATRSANLNGLEIKKKQAIGLLDGKLLAVDDEASEVLEKLLEMVDLSSAEVVTIYYGDDTTEEDAQKVADSIAEKHEDLSVEVVKGEQPHYKYIVSIE